MKYYILIIAILALINCYEHPVNQMMVDEIKATATWTPMEVDENPFANWSIEDIKSLMGAKLGDDNEELANLEILEVDGEELEDYPENFDGRQEWGSSIHPIRDQGKCGSCWAFGATEALSDRFAISSHGDTDLIFSPQDMVSCSQQNYGCNGGFVPKAWNYFKVKGAVTEECVPYVSGDDGQRHACPKTCVNEDVEHIRYKSASIEHASSTKGARAMMMEGPIEAAFSVYEDFMNYKSGIYQHKSGKLLGGHAIKCLGWGKEGDLYYWLCANSWNTSWGDNGFFKIQMGECGINNKIYAAAPVIKSQVSE